jgi:hypothetical protein
MKIKQTWIALGTLICTLGSLEARTVFWGGPTDSVLYQSDGVTPVDSSFTFLLGSFEVGFDPLTAGFETWATNWNTFDQAYLNPTTNFFESTAFMNEQGISNGVNADTTYDFRSKQLYLWVFNSNVFNPLQPTTNESALFTGPSWVMPAEGNPCCGEDNFPLQFYVSNMATAITGTVDPDYDGPGSPIVGPLGSATPPSTAFDFQTHSITVIPEPSVALFGGLSLLGLALRRRRA